jgi:hypothetical protein
MGVWTPTGSYTITVTGTDGTLTHTATAVMNVTMAAIPTVTASPNSGTGATQTFTFTNTGTAGTEPNSMNVLFNTGVDGRSACWMFFGGAQLFLASDDGSLWTGTVNGNPPSISNSQCTLANFTPHDDTAGQMGFSVTITFSPAFAGTKNIFVRGDNSEGGDTGYQLQGTWTVP